MEVFDWPPEDDRRISIECRSFHNMIYLSYRKLLKERLDNFDDPEDIKIDEDLELEGLARDVVRAVQQARKDADLQISDRIKLGISCSDHLNKAIKLHKDYICSQTLCQEIEYRLLQQYDHKSNIKIDNEDLELTIKRI